MKDLKLFAHIFCVVTAGYIGFVLVRAHATWFILGCYIFMIVGFVFLVFCYVREKESEMVKYKLQKDGEVQKIKDRFRLGNTDIQKKFKEKESIYKDKIKSLKDKLEPYKEEQKDTEESTTSELPKRRDLPDGEID